MTESEFPQWLRDEVKRIGTQRKAAAQWGISNQYLNDLLKGRRNIPPNHLLEQMGLRRIVTFERMEK